MVKKNQDDEMYAGNLRDLQYSVVDEDNSDAPLDVTTYTIGWVLARISTEGQVNTTPVLEKNSTTVGDMTIDSDAGTNDRVTVHLRDGDTNDLLGDFYLELELKDGTGETIVVATGTLTINVNVTNAENP